MISKNEAKKIKRFLEEFAWLMDNYSSVDLKKASALISETVGETNEIRKVVGSYESPNPNKHFLTGALPSLFMDSSLFPTNDDIAMFATSVLKLEIPRYHKKSKYEIIGHIVCEANSLDDKGLEKLVKALGVLLGDEHRKVLLSQKQRTTNFNWNHIIQSLTSETDNG